MLIIDFLYFSFNLFFRYLYKVMWPIKDPESTATKRELEKAQRDYPKFWKNRKFDFRTVEHDEMQKVETSLVRILWAFLNLGEERLEVIKIVLLEHLVRNHKKFLIIYPSLPDAQTELTLKSFLGVVFMWTTNMIMSNMDFQDLKYSDVIFFEVFRQKLQQCTVLEDLGISGVEDSEIGGTEVKLLLLALSCRKAQRELGSEEIFDVLALLKRLDYVTELNSPERGTPPPSPGWIKKIALWIQMGKIRRADIRTLLESNKAKATKICSLSGEEFLEAYVEIVLKRIDGLLAFIEAEQGNASLS